MTQLILWMILSYGLMNIMVFSKIFYPVREYVDKWAENPYTSFHGFGKFLSGVLSCPMCFGFHGGWFLSFVVFSPVCEILGVSSYISWFFDGILSSGAVWAINAIIEWFEQNRPSNNNQNIL
jgi:hypothetical protein